MNSISIPPPLDKPHQLLCFICQDILAKPLTASCGHSFCLLCLDQYLLFADTCPICSKTIRGKPLNPVPCLSDFISSIVKTDHEERSRLQSRIQRTKDFMKRRELKGIKVGMMVDIRDVNNIWCVGMVVRIITRYQQPVRLLKINYINYLQKKEEEVPMNSDRLAAKGFYTSRKDIPHYPSRPVHSILNKYQI